MRTADGGAGDDADDDDGNAFGIGIEFGECVLHNLKTFLSLNHFLDCCRCRCEPTMHRHTHTLTPHNHLEHHIFNPADGAMPIYANYV